jgi:hypothetical protein
MPPLNRPHPRPAAPHEAAARTATPAEAASPLPMPVPLLLQLLRPIQDEGDVRSLAAHLDCARARGCF